MTVGSKLILAYYWSDVENAGVLIGWKVPTGTSQTGSMLVSAAWGLISFLQVKFLYLEYLHFLRKSHSDVSKMRT